MSTGNQWSVNDRRFLRSLRIVADEPAPASARFVVEPGRVTGEFHVVDREHRLNDHIFGKGFKRPRDAAEDFARQMNVKHKK